MSSDNKKKSICHNCGAIFTARAKTTKYCSKDCRSKVRAVAALRKMLMNNPRTTPQDKLLFEYSQNQLIAYNKLMTFGIHIFDDQGRIKAVDFLTKKEEKMSGAIFIKDLIAYFVEQDYELSYLRCAELKKLLDEHRKKFK